MASSGNFGLNNTLIRPVGGTVVSTSGNTKITSTSGSWGAPLTMAATTGKWYIEYYVNAGSSGRNVMVVPTNSDKYNQGNYNFATTGDYVIQLNSNGSIYNNNNSTATQSGFTVLQTGDIMAMALNLDASPKTLQYYRNGTSVGTAENINASATGHFTFMIMGHNASTMTVNAGQDSSFAGAKGSGTASAADDNGFGNFYYTPPSGFLAMCTGNLPVDADIDPAQTDDNFPQKNFNAVAYDSTGSGQSITGVGFQPDLVWIKCLSDAQGNGLFDSSRGTSKVLESNGTNAENTSSGLTSFDSDGYSMGTYYNQSGRQYVSWCWRANGGTTASNSDGSITSTVQANTKAGFSIVTYTGNATNGATFGHGLSAKPSLVFIKNRDASQKWGVWHQSMTQDDNKILFLNTNAALTTEGTQRWDVSAISSSVFGLGSHPEINGSGADYVAYIWHDVEGFQKFGRYEGNGNADGPYVYTGFRPRLLFIKNTSTGGRYWTVIDSARNTFNLADDIVNWDQSIAEYSSSARGVDILSNGFKIRGNDSDNNTSGDTYVFGAWGDVPFKYNNIHQQ